MTGKSAASGERTLTIDVTLLGRTYKVTCKESEELELGQAVELVDQRMREIRDSTKTTMVERIAVMTALNLAHELQRARISSPVVNESKATSANIHERESVAPPPIIDAPAARRRIASMRSAIDQVLASQEKLL